MEKNSPAVDNNTHYIIKKEMENKNYRLIIASYELYAIENGTETFIEKTEEDKPMSFYTDSDMVIKSFEDKIRDIKDDTDFELFLTKEEAYGEHDAKSVMVFDRSMFEQDGQLDTQSVFVGAVVPLQNEESQRFLGKVTEITEDKVTVDLNHPLAGMDLKFKGHMLLNREADQDEVDNFFQQMNSSSSCGCGGSCGCGCSNEGGSCNCGGNGDGNCGCGCN